MPKPLAFFLMFLLLVGGVLLGNQYGRRDLENSRPPQIEGNVGLPGSVVVNTDSYRLESYTIYKTDKTETYGAVSVLTKNAAAEAVVYFWRANTGVSTNRFVLSLFTSDNHKVRDLTTFNLNTDSATIIRTIFERPEPGQYLGFVPEGANAPVFVTNAF